MPRHSRQHARLVSQVGGIPTAEMNSLELEFLFMINFTLNVTPEVYRYLRPIALRTPRAILATDAAAAGARRQYEHELMMRKFLQAQCSCAGSRLLVHERASKLMGPGAAAGQIFALQRPSQPQQVLVMEPHAKMRLSQRPKLFLRRCSNSLCRSTRLLSGSRRQRAQRALGPPRTALRCWSTTSLGSLGKL